MESYTENQNYKASLHSQVEYSLLKTSRSIYTVAQQPGWVRTRKYTMIFPQHCPIVLPRSRMGCLNTEAAGRPILQGLWRMDWYVLEERNANRSQSYIISCLHLDFETALSEITAKECHFTIERTI